jgi:2-methylisocitrate lyase-like PEP mutase family enzyme
MTTAAADRAAHFLALHQGDQPLLMPNPWDAGSAKLLASLGFDALATTSSGFAGTLGRLDGQVTRDEALAHAEVLVAAVDMPVSADLENGFGDGPSAVADTIRLAVATGLAGGSIEDYSGHPGGEIYELGLAVERINGAVDAAHSGSTHFVLTARAENLIRGRPDLPDTIARLQAYQDAGADVLFAPGLSTVAEVETVVRSVDRPLNVLVRPGGPTVAELAGAGARRLSVGGSFSYVAVAAVAAAARELMEQGTLGFMDQVIEGAGLARSAYR